MKKLIPFALLLSIITACSNSNSQSDSTEIEASETLKENLEEAEVSQNEVIPEAENKLTIDSEILASEPTPYTIKSFFKFYLNDEEKANQVLNSKWNPDSSPGQNGNYEDQIDILDVQNGYMKVVTPVADGFMYTEYVYWTLTEKKKLFGVNKVIKEPFTGEITTEKFDFRIFNEDKWEDAEIGILTQITQDISSQTKEELLKNETLTSLFEMPNSISPETSFSYRLKLPRNGKDISFWLNINDGAEVISTQEITMEFDEGVFNPILE